MFCQKCGSELQAGANFCGKCGQALGTLPAVAGEGGAAALPQATPQGKTFLDKGGVVVTDAILRTPTGASFPIRNISSVIVEQKSPNVLVLILAIVLALPALGGILSGSLIGWILAVGAAALWFVATRCPYYLKLGSGGVPQTAIESNDGALLREVEAAIGEAVLHIQRR